MPIQVLCSGCKTRFAVHEKFAGKQGPCPKCKAIIKIPEVAADEGDIKVHEPDPHASGGKTVTGQPTGKPLTRKEAKITPAILAGGIGGALVVAGAAYFLGETLQEQPLLLGAGLVAITFPLTAFFYAILRNDELEPFRGTNLLLRAALCTIGYAGLWGAHAVAAMYLTDPWAWAFAGIPFLLIGSGIAFLTFDMQAENALFHYGFYLLITLLLRWLVGLPPVWLPGG
jgi:hypothetical protein